MSTSIENSRTPKRGAEIAALNSDWAAIVELSKDSEFLATLQKYWQKFSKKRGKSFEAELRVRDCSQSEHPDYTYQAIELNFFRETINYLKSHVKCYTYFAIFYDPELGLIIKHLEFEDGTKEKKFEGTLEQFYEYMATKLTAI